MTPARIGHRDPRTTITAIAEEAASLGYRTLEELPVEDLDGRRVKLLQLHGHHRRFDACFRLNPATGYWAFWRGERPATGVRYGSMRQFRIAIREER